MLKAELLGLPLWYFAIVTPALALIVYLLYRSKNLNADWQKPYAIPPVPARVRKPAHPILIVPAPDPLLDQRFKHAGNALLLYATDVANGALYDLTVQGGMKVSDRGQPYFDIEVIMPGVPDPFGREKTIVLEVRVYRDLSSLARVEYRPYGGTHIFHCDDASTEVGLAHAKEYLERQMLGNPAVLVSGSRDFSGIHQQPLQ